ncbi:MAG: hypothetical protein WC154_00290 [Candidatus Izemoplasmatales bacterium]
MATIQIKRRTSEGTGPLVGTSGTIKAGEPQVDFNGEHLYVAKADKTGSSSVPLVESDYLKIPGVNKVNNQIDTKITALGLGSAATKNVGTGNGNIPVLNSYGKLVDSVVPKIAMTNTFVVTSQTEILALSTAQEGDVAVRTDLNKSFILKATPYNTLSNWQELLTPTDAVTSVNGQTGVVTISLAGLGGVSTGNFDSHVSSDLHLTTEQKSIIDNVIVSEIVDSNGIALASTSTIYANKVIMDGLVYHPYVDTDYTMPGKVAYKLGIDKTKVLQPSSVIDGGTY